ncbi:MAG: hypothetical protein CML56_07045 [Rhodobacteraceae bacterium]|nr:hypothetical protein [Paracoccaceae bacterium]|tara:strand:- start:723 stop:926 length:204 start_codon:yes stop_codon:yes gene_type:complete
MSARLLTVGFSLLIGIATTTLMVILGSVGWNGSIFIGLITTVMVGAFLNWILFLPLPPIENGRIKTE